jgi:hypothetical protein
MHQSPPRPTLAGPAQLAPVAPQGGPPPLARPPRLAALAFGLAAACTGSIDTGDGLGTPGEKPGDTSNPAKPGERPGQTPTTPGEMRPSDPGGPKACTATSAPTQMRRLTNDEYRRTLRDLFGSVAANEAAAELPGEGSVGGFENNAEAQSLSAKHLGAYLEVSERLTAAVLADARVKSAFFGCAPTGAQRASCTTAFLQRFGRRAWRRPLTAAELDELTALARSFDADPEPYAGLEATVQALLTSPNFLFLVETGTKDPARPGFVRLTGTEIAARLSYLLVGTTPDDKLLDAATTGALDTKEGVAAAARALVADARGGASRRAFFGRWLHVNELGAVTREAAHYPAWSDALRDAMAEETNRFVDELTGPNGNLLDLVTADWGHVNDTLAKHYGVEAPAKGTWARQKFAAGQRGAGILTQASFLTVAALSEKATPIKRGQRVRLDFLCDQLPSAPPGVPTIEEVKLPAGASERAHLAEHEKNPQCAGCHKMLDPVGFGLAHYDTIGAYRKVDSTGAKIDARGRFDEVPGSDFDGAAELGARLRAQPRYAQCFATQLFRYAVARQDVAEDACTLGLVGAAFTKGGGTYASLVDALVTSDAFRLRRMPTGGAL